ncbi:MAG: efflux RND transporter periplasmic adaptor subunit [Bacillota bacterium]
MTRGTRLWLIVGGIILTAAVIAAAAVRGFGTAALEVKVAAAEEKLFEDKVLATGKVETLYQAEVVAPFAARLVRLKVKEGDRVAAGEVLAELDTSDVEDRVKEAEAALAAAETELSAALAPARPEEIAQAEAALEAAEAAAEAAEKKLERYRFLFEQEAVSEAELEAAEIGYTQAKAEATAAEVRLAALKEKDPKQIEVYRARVNQARVAVENARRAAAKGRLTSPITGVVLQRTAKQGDYLQPGLPVLTVGDPERLQVVADLSEQDVRGVRAGQDAEINWIGRPDKTWRAKVARVSPAVTRKTELETEKAVRVYIALDEPGLLPGATVDVIIHRVRPRKAVLVPTEAVVEKGKEKAVFAVDKGVARKRTVDVGGSNELYSEIRAGLKAGTRVILNPPADLRDGQPVRVSGGVKQ